MNKDDRVFKHECSNIYSALELLQQLFGKLSDDEITKELSNEDYSEETIDIFLKYNNNEDVKHLVEKLARERHEK